MSLSNPKQYVELFHLLFLNQLGKKLDKKFYALKGGCNMRFYFDSIRYSEDMDIDIQTIAKTTLQNKVNQILNSQPFKQILISRHIELFQISQPKQTDTTQRWKIALKTPTITLPLNTKIEFSRRKLDKEILFEPINANLLRHYSLPPILSNHYAAATMLQQKILALALRNQTQARDIFDLYFLIQSGIQLPSKNKKLSEHIETAQENALNISFSDFKGQVLAFLSEDYYQQYNDQGLWSHMVTTVIDMLETFHETN